MVIGVYRIGGQWLLVQFYFWILVVYVVGQGFLVQWIGKGGGLLDFLCGEELIVVGQQVVVSLEIWYVNDFIEGILLIEFKDMVGFYCCSVDMKDGVLFVFLYYLKIESFLCMLGVGDFDGRIVRQYRVNDLYVQGLNVDVVSCVYLQVDDVFWVNVILIGSYY